MQETSAALIDQLVYIDSFTINQDTPNLDVDGQLSLDLAAFADDSFIFADEEKPDVPADDENNQDFRNHDDEKYDPLPVSFRELPASNNPLENNWFQHDGMAGMAHDETNSHGLLAPVDAGNTRGHQLALTLNDKIQSTKRGKSQSHNVHDSDSFLQQGTGSSEAQSNVFAHAPHSGYLDQEGAREHPPSLQVSPRPSVSNPGVLLLQMHTVRGDIGSDGIPDLSGLPKFPVPPGAKSSLKRAGLSQTHIDLLCALIAQHQSSLSGASGTPTKGAQAQPNPLVNGITPAMNEFALQVKPEDTPSYQSNINNLAPKYSSRNSSASSSIAGSQLDVRESYFDLGQPTARVDQDKRRRNTAASARFRVKKKMKEKDMEEKIDQLTKAIKSFEVKIDDLEAENRLLKGLIIERGNRESDEELKKLKDRARS